MAKKKESVEPPPDAIGPPRMRGAYPKLVDEDVPQMVAPETSEDE